MHSRSADTRFRGAVAVVTGAANGIGAAVARRLAAQGARVAVADIDDDPASHVAAAIAEAGGGAIAVHLDITDEAQWADAVRLIESRFDTITLLHANAALTASAAVGDGISPVDLPYDTWNRVMTVNAGGCFLSCKHVIPSMLRAGGGAIVITSSIAALRGKVENMTYAASKAAVLSLSRSIAAGYGRHNIRCNTVSPGAIATQVLADVDQSSLDTLAGQTMLGRIGTPDDLAGVVTFLLSDDAAFITGQMLVADGGSTSRQAPR